MDVEIRNTINHQGDFVRPEIISEIIIKFPSGLKDDKELLQFSEDTKIKIYNLLKQYYGYE